MHIRTLYTTENVHRAKLAQIGATVIAGIICASAALSMFGGAKEAIETRLTLAEKKKDERQILRDAKRMSERKFAVAPSDGGVEIFAMEVSRWAEKSGVKIESLTPEGTPITSEVKMDEVKLGTWIVSKVRVKGHGDFGKLMCMFDELRKPLVPVHLDSFQLQSMSEQGDGNVSFDIVVNVYEKKGSAG